MTLQVRDLKDGRSVYLTIDRDMVDQIAFAHYGTNLATTELIYEANPGLSRETMLLPAGVEILLPTFTPPEPPRQIQLWD